MADAPEIKHIFSAEDEDCLSLETMRAYTQGRLQPAARHGVERHLLNCELCSMAIEGIEGQPDAVIEAGATAISSAAWDRVQAKQKRRGAFIWISAAASVILLVGIGWAFLRPPTDEKMQAVFSEMIEETQADDTLLQDGIAQNRPSPDEAPYMEPMPAEVANESPTAATRQGDIQRKMAKDNVQYAPAPTAAPIKPGTLPTWGSSGPVSGKDALKGGTTASPRVFTADEALEAPPVNSDFGATEDDAVAFEQEAQEEKTAVISSNHAAGVTIDQMVIADKSKNKKLQEERRRADSKSAPMGKAVAAAPKSPAKEEAEAKRDADGYLADAPMVESITLSSPASKPTIAMADSVALGRASTGSAFDLGMDAYLRKDYPTAATQLRAAAAQTPSNLQAHLYAANAFLNIGQPEAAIFHLDRILAQAPNSYTEDAEWYKALAYLKMNDASAAKRQLNKVQDAGGKHSQKARKSLEKL